VAVGALVARALPARRREAAPAAQVAAAASAS
jgi:hypothetical protein